jgi:hypothetical protein
MRSLSRNMRSEATTVKPAGEEALENDVRRKESGVTHRLGIFGHGLAVSSMDWCSGA